MASFFASAASSKSSLDVNPFTSRQTGIQALEWNLLYIAIQPGIQQVLADEHCLVASGL